MSRNLEEDSFAIVLPSWTNLCITIGSGDCVDLGQITQAMRTGSVGDRVSCIVNIGFALSPLACFGVFVLLTSLSLEDLVDWLPGLVGSVCKVILIATDRLLEFLVNPFSAIFFSHSWLAQVPDTHVRLRHVHVLVQAVRRSHNPLDFHLDSRVKDCRRSDYSCTFPASASLPLQLSFARRRTSVSL